VVIRRRSTVVLCWLSASTAAAQGANGTPAQVTVGEAVQDPAPTPTHAPRSIEPLTQPAAAKPGATRTPARPPADDPPQRRAPPQGTSQPPAQAPADDPTRHPAPIDEANEMTARLAFERGLRALREQRWPQAEVEFRRSFELVPRASTAYDLALVLFKQQHFRASAECLQQLLHRKRVDLTEHDAPYRGYAEALLDQVLKQLASMRLALEPSSAQLRIDGESTGLGGPTRVVPLDPGAHHVEVTASGFAAISFNIVSAPGIELQREVKLTPALALKLQSAPPADPSPSSLLTTTGPWLTMGLGGALLIGAVVTGLVADHVDDGFNRSCPTHRACDPSLKSKRDEVVALGTASDILLASGAGLVAAGITWRLLIGTNSQHDRRGANVLIGASVTHF
jgi:hypothetical protein